MYHALVISLIFVPFLDEYRAAPGWPAALLLHALVAAFTLLFAALSKRFIEDKFIRHKWRFQTVHSARQVASVAANSDWRSVARHKLDYYASTSGSTPNRAR